MADTGIGATVPAHKLASKATQEGQKKAALTSVITHTWNVSRARVSAIVAASLIAARLNHLDPVLVLSVVAQESGFRAVGNPGTTTARQQDVDPMQPHGLMQIAGRWHPEKFPNGQVAVTDDRTNVFIGASVLKEYLVLERGDVKRALQRYNGNLADGTFKYAHQVLRHQRQLRAQLKSLKDADPGAIAELASAS